MVTISITDGDYRKWVEDLGKRFRQSQIKAAVSVNSEMLRFYWELGRDIVEMHIEERWGDNVIKNLSVDLQREIPNAHCFSRTNLYYTRAFYLLYSQHQKNIPQVEGEISSPLENQIVPQAEGQLPDQILPQVGAELFSIPWGHHKYIMDKCSSDPDKALFYVRQTLENGWSRAVLLNWMDSNLYERQGKAITNFKVTLPEANSDLAQEITKDPYNFAFAGITGKYNERKLKDALLSNITQFLVELGTGFAYVGKEYRLQIGETENFIDLLFYNLRLRCYVAIEVKIDKFDSRDIGQLGTYVTAVNHLLRDEQKDNPTIGLLICKSKDSMLAQYALESSSQPLGISEYDLQKLYPAQLEGTMPTVEELESNLKKLVTSGGKTLVTSDGYQLSVSSDSEGNEDESPASKGGTPRGV